jgi:hypothetical protein
MILHIPRKGKAYQVLLDDADWDLIKDWSWYINRGKTAKSWYAVGNKNGIQIQMHRLIMGAGPGDIIDHKNENGLDCRRDNMRFVTKSGNQRNAHKINNKTGFRGVSHDYYRAGIKSGKFRARINIDGKEKMLGVFDTPEEASIVYEKEFENQMEISTIRKV